MTRCSALLSTISRLPSEVFISLVSLSLIHPCSFQTNYDYVAEHVQSNYDTAVKSFKRKGKKKTANFTSPSLLENFKSLICGKSILKSCFLRLSPFIVLPVFNQWRPSGRTSRRTRKTILKA